MVIKAFWSRDLHRMTLTYKPDPDILKLYTHTKNEICSSRLSKLTTRTGQLHTERQTDAIEHITTPHWRVTAMITKDTSYILSNIIQLVVQQQPVHAH